MTNSPDRFPFHTMITSKHYKKAKAEFEKAFGAFSVLMFKKYNILYEMPELYYSEELAEKGEE